MDKSLMLNMIKREMKIKTDLEFASFLGIAQSTLSSWHQRMTFDAELIIAKCNIIDGNWLLTGKGNMLKEYAPQKEAGSIVAEPQPQYNQGEYKALKEIIEQQKKRIALLDEMLKIKNDHIKNLQAFETINAPSAKNFNVSKIESPETLKHPQSKI